MDDEEDDRSWHDNDQNESTIAFKFWVLIIGTVLSAMILSIPAYIPVHSQGYVLRFHEGCIRKIVLEVRNGNSYALFHFRDTHDDNCKIVVATPWSVVRSDWCATKHTCRLPIYNSLAYRDTEAAIYAYTDCDSENRAYLIRGSLSQQSPLFRVSGSIYRGFNANVKSSLYSLEAIDNYTYLVHPKPRMSILFDY